MHPNRGGKLLILMLMQSDCRRPRMNDDNTIIDTGVLEEQEKEVAEKEVSVADPVTTAGEVVTTANVEVTTASAPTTTIDELTLAQTLIEIKAAKPKAVTSAAGPTATTQDPRLEVVVQEPSIGVSMDLEDTMNDDTPIGVASAVQEGVTPYVADRRIEMEKQNSLEDTTVLESFPPY
ncbi:hypothetical protein Tco_0698826 [Tanacetum coccineum]